MTTYNTRPVVTSSYGNRPDYSTYLWSASNLPWKATFFPWQWVYPINYNARPVVTSSYNTRPIIP